jgi:hypothetical protein
MILNDTAAAYGLFQVVFAELTDHLAVATFRLRKQKESGLVFEKVFDQKFSRILEQFRRELQQSAGRSCVADSLSVLCEACEMISKLADWRNERIHARVLMTEQGYTLYNWRTRYPLEISQSQIEKKIELANKAMVELRGRIPDFVHLLNWDAEFEALLNTLPDLNEELAEIPIED